MSEMPEPQPDSSPNKREEKILDEEFSPPSFTSLASLVDGRSAGDFESRYSKSAWLQISLELVYLLLVLFGTIILLIWMARAVVLNLHDGFYLAVFGSSPANIQLVVWAAAGLSGAAGGAAFALKWLYHSVAKQNWHRDRVVWRIVVPPVSAVLSVYTGLMIVSGLLPFVSHASLSNPVASAAFGFFIGYFSDHLLASLQKFAYRIFGTINQRGD